MSSGLKPIISKEETFDKLDIRIGRVIAVEKATASLKPSYVIKADFGKYGVKTSVGRFTSQSIEELSGRQILGVLNFQPREIGGVVSEFLCLGVQFPGAESGEAAIISPVIEAKIGGKLF